jgi:hypothetical protein
MDKQAKAIKQAVPVAQVERVGEGINVTFNLCFTISDKLQHMSDFCQSEPG